VPGDGVRVHEECDVGKVVVVRYYVREVGHHLVSFILRDDVGRRWRINGVDGSFE